MSYFHSNQPRGAHRVSWELAFGEIPKGLSVLHDCDNRKCVNPDHLFTGTQADNMKGMVSKGRSLTQNGDLNNGRKLNSNQVREIRRLLEDGSTLSTVSEMFGTCYTNCIHIRDRKTWKLV